MACEVVVLAGPARCGKTSRLLCAYRQVLARGPFATAAWLSPHHRAASAVGAKLLEGAADFAGSLNPNLLTFDQLATRVLASAARPMRPLSRGMVRALLRRVVEESLAAGELPYFQPIAGTTGFLDLLTGFIRELKRLEIWPEELAAAQGRKASPRDRELRLLYQAYQDLLNHHHLFDRQGQFWAARALIKEGHWGPLTRTREVFIDGFSDFTRTELDILELWARRAERITFALTFEQHGGREELFGRSADTLAALRERLPQLQVQWMPRRTLSPAPVDHLERGLFGNPRQASTLENPIGIEILAAAGVTHEVELVAGRIKALLVGAQGAAPVAADEVLVVFRSLSEIGSLVREVFTRFGIPAAIASTPPLSASPCMAALLIWLRLDLEDWPYRVLLAALGNNYFQPEWVEVEHDASASLARLVRELELPRGREQLLSSITWLENKAAEVLAEKRRLAPKLLAATAGGELARRIAHTLDALPRRATPGEWRVSLRKFATELGMFRAIGESPLGAEAISQDVEAWKRLDESFAESERLSRWSDRPAPRWDRAQLMVHLTDVLGSETLPAVGDESGKVRVLAAETVRGLEAPYVFVCGLSERAFPPPNREDCLYTDADARRWGASGLPLPSNAQRRRFEMLLFYEVITRATRQLVLSYPALDAAAQPLVPSPYLREVEHACGQDRIPRNDRPHLDCIPPSDEVYCLRDFRVRAVSKALADCPAMFRELCSNPISRDVARSIFAGLSMTESRDRGATYGSYEGMFESQAARVKLAERFGAEHCWSPSQLEQYAYCPHQFFLKNVLRVRPLTEPELAIDYLGRGQMLHWLLAQAHRELNGNAGVPTSPSGRALAEFNAAVQRLAAELRNEARSGPIAGGLVEINVRKILQWLEHYHGQHASYDRQWESWQHPPRPAHFEVAFGPQHAADSDERAEAEDSLSSPDPFVLVCEGENIQFNGRIDRIDLGQFGTQTTFTVVDYKSGKTSKRTSLDAVRRGDSLQLPVYALATQKLLAEQGALPFRAAYWHFSDAGYKEDEAVKFHIETDGRLQISDEWLEMESQLKTRVAALVRGIRAGEFPMHSADDKCTSLCDYRTVCRVNQARVHEKTWQPPGSPAE